MAQNVRITHAAVEVLRAGDPQPRITHAAVEVLRAGDPQPRITYTAVEVLRSSFTTTTTTHFWDEDFDGMTPGNPPTGWSELWSTAPLTTVETAGKDKSLSVDISANVKFVAANDAVDKYNVEALGLLQALDAFATLAAAVGVRISGGSGSETGYVVFLDCANERLLLRRYKNGLSSNLDTYAITITAGQWYWLRVRVEDDNIKVKAWDRQSEEPASWQIDYTDSTNPISSSGSVGVCTYNADAYCDHFLAESYDANWPITLPAGYVSTTTTTTTTTTHTTTTGTTTTTAEGQATYATDFSEYDADDAPDDWTEIWEPPVAAANVRDDLAFQYLQIDHSTFGHYLIQWDDVGLAKDTDVLAKLQFGDAYPTTGQDYFKIVVRQTGGASNKNGYELRAYPYNDVIRIFKWVNGVATQIGPTISKTFDSYWYWARLRVEGNLLKARVWQGQPSEEPGTWDISVTDSTHAGVYGTAGIGSYNGDYTRVAYYAVGTGGLSASAPSDYITTTTTTTTTTATTTTGTTESPMDPAWYVSAGVLQNT